MTENTTIQEEVCELCGGDGEIDTFEQVYPNEPHTALIGKRKCLCRIKDDDEYGE